MEHNQSAGDKRHSPVEQINRNLNNMVISNNPEEEQQLINDINSSAVDKGPMSTLSLHPKLKKFKWADNLFVQCQSEQNENVCSGSDHILDEHIQRLSRLRSWRTKNISQKRNRAMLRKSTRKPFDIDEEDCREANVSQSHRKIIDFPVEGSPQKLPHVTHFTIKVVPNMETLETDKTEGPTLTRINIPNWITRPIHVSDVKLLLLNNETFSSHVASKGTRYFIRTTLAKEGQTVPSFVELKDEDLEKDLSLYNAKEYSFRIIPH